MCGNANSPATAKAIVGLGIQQQIVVSASDNRTGHAVFLVVFFQIVGEFADAVGDVFKFGVGVAHGHANIGVTHGLLDDCDGYALIHENCRMGMSQSVNINHLIHCVTFLNSGGAGVKIVKNASHLAEVGEIAAKITVKHGNLMCVECAEELVKAFKQRGIRGEVLEIVSNAPYNRGYIQQVSTGINI